MRPVHWLNPDGRFYMIAVPGRRWQRVWSWQVRYAVPSRDGPAVGQLVVHQRSRRVRGYTGHALGWRWAIWRAGRAIDRAVSRGDA